jgi:pimeloyl-ACP methyl ester carboxylesterase
MSPPQSTGYAPVNGLGLYYEIHGRGEPLILLHGGVVGISMFGTNVAALAEERKVIAVELQGHGHTADIDRPLSFEAMAEDVAGLMAHLDLDRADVMGWSLGGGVALRLAIGHPRLVRRLVIVSAPCKRQGWYPEVLQGMASIGPEQGEMMKSSPLAEAYPHIDWSVLFTKLSTLLRQEYDWSSEVAALEAPAMLAFADADAIPTSHMAEFFGLLGGGKRDAGLDGALRPASRLAVLPGLTHYDIGSDPALVRAVLPFLAQPQTTAVRPPG